jgi:hypothetical protein
MKKQFLILSLVISLVLVSSFVSAGLCRGNDGFYHNCDEFYSRDGYKVYSTEHYYDRDKYSTYNDYRNKFSPSNYVTYYKKNYKYEVDKGDSRTYYHVEEGKSKSRTYYYKSSDGSYVKGYDKGYYDGYDYGYESGDRGYKKGYNYYQNYDSRVNDFSNKIIYSSTDRDRCKNEWVCYKR